MNAYPSTGNTSKRPSILASIAGLIFRLLRMYWLTVLVLLVAVIYGVRAGWSTPRQWSDGLFVAAVFQMIVGGISTLGSSSAQAINDASSARYVIDADVHETRNQVISDYAHQRSFGLRAFVGALFIVLIAALALLV